ncbi:MAG: hypothetical protein HON90_18170 [Halobacteriovoraceae bacterium]|jgi:DNA-binding winged helix-turn-helix (wHTH) protein|nr:hypothetical protein [Halobacteriovoraceae bacterium]
MRYDILSVNQYFFGREKELQLLGQEIEKKQLVAITGLPAIGKSELSLQLLNDRGVLNSKTTLYLQLPDYLNNNRLLNLINTTLQTSFETIEHCLLHLGENYLHLVFHNLDFNQSEEFELLLQKMNRYLGECTVIITVDKNIFTTSKSVSVINLDPLDFEFFKNHCQRHLKKNLSSEQLHKLYQLTKGLPYLIQKYISQINYFFQLQQKQINHELLNEFNLKELAIILELLEIKWSLSHWENLAKQLAYNREYQQSYQVCIKFSVQPFFDVYQNFNLYYLGDYETVLNNTLKNIKRYSTKKEILALNYSIRGLALLSTNSPQEALECQKKSLSLSIQVQDKDLIGQSYWCLSFVYFRLSQYKPAKKFILLAIQYLESSQGFYYLGFSYLNAFAVEAQLKNYQEAQVYLEKTKQLTRNYHNFYIYSAYLRNQAWLSSYNGDLQQAIELYKNSAQLLASNPKNNDYIISRIALAEIYLVENRLKDTNIIIQDLKLTISSQNHVLFSRVQNLEISFYLQTKDVNKAEEIHLSTKNINSYSPTDRIERELQLAEIALFKNEIHKASHHIYFVENIFKKNNISPYYYNYPIIKSKYYSLFNIQLQTDWISEVESYCKHKIENSKILLFTYEILILLHIKRRKFKQASEILEQAKKVAIGGKYTHLTCVFELLDILVRFHQHQKIHLPNNRDKYSRFYQVIYLFLEHRNSDQSRFRDKYNQLCMYEKNLVSSILPLTSESLPVMIKSNSKLLSHEEFQVIIKKNSYQLFFDEQKNIIRNHVKEEVKLKKDGPLYELLKLFCTSYPHSLPLEQIYQSVWGGEYNPEIHNTKIYTSINRLRSLITTKENKIEMIMNNSEGYALSERCQFYYLFCPDTATISKNSRNILKIFNSSLSISCREVIANTGLNRSKVKRELKNLVVQGIIKKSGLGKGTTYTKV